MPNSPRTMLITCSDTRIDPFELPGLNASELFVCQNFGNIVPGFEGFSGDVVASIEYAVRQLGVQDIIICGHTHCRAMRTNADQYGTAKLPATQSWLRHMPKARMLPPPTPDEAIEQHVLQQLQHLRMQPAVFAALDRGHLKLHAWIVDDATRAVRVYDPEAARFHVSAA